MGVEPFETSAAEGQRTAKRARVLLAAKLHTPAKVFDARLRDLSREGALIESPALVKAGMRVIFERGATKVPATVAWFSGFRIGLAFDHPIDESELLIHIRRPTPAAAPPPAGYSRPGIFTGMSDRERKMAHAWSVAVGLNLPERD